MPVTARVIRVRMTPTGVIPTEMVVQTLTTRQCLGIVGSMKSPTSRVLGRVARVKGRAMRCGTLVLTKPKYRRRVPKFSACTALVVRR